MTPIKILLAFLASILLVNCTQDFYQSMDMSVAIQNAKTKADHEALAAHYEQMAHQMQLNVEEHKKNLDEYQALFPPYDRQFIQLKYHCTQLIKIYTQAEKENLELARLHRQIASQLTN